MLVIFVFEITEIHLIYSFFKNFDLILVIEKAHGCVDDKFHQNSYLFDVDNSSDTRIYHID